MNKWKRPPMSGLLATALLGTALPAAALLEIHHLDSANLPTIDGNISEWVARSATPDLNQSKFASTAGEISGTVPESDQKVEVWLGWNDQTNLIYIAARVTDNHFGTTSISAPGSVWQSDDMEVFIDADNSGGEYNSDNAHAQQYIINPGGTNGVVLFPFAGANPPKTQAAVKRSGTTYTYEMAIPGWDALTANGNGTRHTFSSGQTIGLTLVFADFESMADADGVNYHAYNGLNGPVGASHNADQFTDFQLAAGSNTSTGTVVSQVNATGDSNRRRRKPVAVESSSWGEVKISVSAADAEGK